MENIFVEFLPPWIETGRQPAFYDKESGSVLQQTARMYARVNMLIRMFNKLSKQTKEVIEEYIGKFNELHDYVEDYFANLDVQEEINNKLDDMVEAGTLQEIITAYIQANVAWTFDTVADLKTATNLVDGSFAQTLGYHNINDGGSSIYKIVDDNELVDDGGSIIELDSGLKATLVVNNTIRIAQFGIDGNHGTNIGNFVTYINNHNLINTVEFESGIAYPLDVNMTITKPNLTIKGNGASIKISDTVKRSFLFTITTTGTCKIEDLLVDGSDMPQDQWSETIVSNYSNRTCFYINSPSVIAKNIRIKDVWGTGLMLRGYENVDISDCVFDKIGGNFWYVDPQTSLFDFNGDAIYLSGHSKDATISVNNCKFIGYQNTDSTKNDSRCGIVFENLTGYDMTGIKTNVEVTNSIFANFSRFLHHEAYASKTHLVYENCQILNTCCAICSAGGIANTDTTINNSKITYKNTQYLGTGGIRNFNINVNRSTIELTDSTYHPLSTESNAVYNDCIINNIINEIAINPSSLTLNRCTLNFNDSYAGHYLLYSASGKKANFNNCTFNKTTQFTNNDFNSGSASVVRNCTFNNLIPSIRPIFDDLESVVYFETEPSNLISKFVRYNASKCTFYIANALYSRPNINNVIPAQENAYGLEGNGVNGNLFYKGFANTSQAIIPSPLPKNITLKNNSRYIMLMYASTDVAQIYANNFSNIYYTDLTFNTSGVASIGTINTKGTISAGATITFNTGAMTCTCATGAAYYMVWILPYEYKDMLGLS